MADQKTDPRPGVAIMLFHRDLRLVDNTALTAAAGSGHRVLPLFIFTPAQLDDKNAFRSDFALQFMDDSLQDLQSRLEEHGGRLAAFFGEPTEILEKIRAALEKGGAALRAIYFNRGYTPYARARDHAIAVYGRSHGAEVHVMADLLLNEPERVKTKAGTPYTVFTPFFKTASQLDVPLPSGLDLPKRGLWHPSPLPGEIGLDLLRSYYIPSDSPAQTGGRARGLELLRDLGTLTAYATERDIPALDATSHLSPHLKFGTVSVREVYHAIVQELGAAHPLLRQLYWRDFFTQIAFHFPHVFGAPFREKYAGLPWNVDDEVFAQWKRGETGFPIVDAGMRQLLQTGTMHNRVRMIVASFLVKDLHMDWQRGERHFAQYLVDYDPAVNNGNWQWAASTGCDAQPYFRVFNPWRQQKRFDPECVYIKRWVPALRDIPCTTIHNYFKPQSPKIADYPRPVVDHAVEAPKAKLIYRSVADR